MKEKEILSYKLKHFHQLSRLSHLLKMQRDVDTLEVKEWHAKCDKIENLQGNYRPLFFAPEGDGSENVENELKQLNELTERIHDLEDRLHAWKRGVSYAQVLGIVDFTTIK